MIYSLKFNYSVILFFMDLILIYQEIFKPYIIINSFKDSGIWPLSYK